MALSNPDNVITPGRRTQVFFDLGGEEASQSYWGGTRYGSEIASNAHSMGRDGLMTQNMRYWPGSNCWTLQPLQENLPIFQAPLPTGIVADDYFVRPHVTNIVGTLGAVGAVISEIYAWSTPYGVGMVHRPSMPDTADTFYQKVVPSNGFGWTDAILSVAPVDPQTAGVLSTPAAPMQTVLNPPNLMRADQGFCLRWWVPGTQLHYPDYILNFHFGQYCLVIKGDGQALLMEYAKPKGGGAYRWAKRFSFQYCRPSQVCAQSHKLIIFPVIGLFGEKRIHFSGNFMEQTAGASLQGGVSLQEEVWQATVFSRGQDIDESPDNVTKAGTCRLDIRSDLRVGWQVSRLMFLPTGSLTDAAFIMPPFGSSKVVNTTLYSRFPQDYNAGDALPIQLSIALKDFETGADVTGVPTSGNVYAVFNFRGWNKVKTGLANDSPILFGYHLYREASTQMVNRTPEIFSPNSLTFSNQTRTPDQDRGALLITDLSGGSRLKNRGSLPVKVVLEAFFDDESDPEYVTIFKGDCLRPKRIRHGKPGQVSGFSPASPARVFPSDEWSQYQCPIVGPADAVKRHFNAAKVGIGLFAIDPAVPLSSNGTFSPWKVTDVITWLLKQAGVPSSQVSIPDNPIRLFAGIGPVSDLMYEPNADIIERCVSLARNYLGAYLVFDPNLGRLAPDSREDAGSPEGAWTLRWVPPVDADPIWNFVGGPTTANVPPLLPSSYPPLTAPFLDRQEGYVIPPETNHVLVFSALPVAGTKGWAFYADAYNPNSYLVPGGSAIGWPDPDPNSPHYLGRESLMIVPEPTAYIPNDPTGTQEALQFIADRIITFAAARRVQPIYAPLVLPVDADTGRLRTLRFGDPVTYRGEDGWFVGSVTPDYNNDRNQLAWYELIKPEPITYS